MNFFLSKDPKPHSKNRNLKNNYSICKIPSSAYKLGVTWILGSLSNDNGDGNENVTNLHI